MNGYNEYVDTLTQCDSSSLAFLASVSHNLSEWKNKVVSIWRQGGGMHFVVFSEIRFLRTASHSKCKHGIWTTQNKK